MNIQWENKFEIGVERIDAEHRIFLGLIKDLDDAVEAGKEREKLKRIVEEIRLYAQFHFLSEENIMIDNAYPRLEEHRDEHRQLLSLLGERAYRFNIDAGNPGKELVEFVFQWFALHTTQVDKQIADHIRQRSAQV